jgi:hypothetical protein
MKLDLTNTSRWPTPFLKLVIRWLMTKQEFSDRMVFVVKRDKWVPRLNTLVLRVRHTNRTRHGRAWLRLKEATLACARRVSKERLKDRYYRYAWSAEHELRSSVEMLVKILAHEMRHLDPDNHRGTTKQGCEHDAEHYAWCRVLEWREWWPAVGRARYRRQVRPQVTAEPALVAAGAFSA